MLKIIHSSSTWLPQTQTWLYSQVKKMNNLDVETHVVAEKLTNLDQFTVDNIHSLDKEPRYRQMLKHSLFSRLRRRLRAHDYQKKLAKVSKCVEPDVIHSHFGDRAWMNLNLARKANARHAVTFYGFDVNKLPMENPIWRKRYKQLFKEADLFLCEGTHMVDCLTKLGCPTHKIKVQHLGVDVDNIAFRPRQWSRAEPLRVLIAASFREKKGIPYAIKALQEVAKNTPLQLTIIGDASEDPYSKKEKGHILTTLEHSGLRESTRLLGYQPHHVMLQEAYDHHFFLQPSITAADGDTEGGAPVALIEMLATGMPVVATTHCDIPEVAGLAFSDFLAPERNVERLAQCIEALLDKPESWASLTKQGREHVELEYNLNRQAERLVDSYRQLIGDNSQHDNLARPNAHSHKVGAN